MTVTLLMEWVKKKLRDGWCNILCDCGATCSISQPRIQKLSEMILKSDLDKKSKYNVSY